MSDKDEATRLADALESGTYLLSVERSATAALLRRWPDEEITPIDAIYAAWHGAGVDIAGGDWRRFVGMLPPTLSAPPAESEPNLGMYKAAIKQVRGLQERIAALEAENAELRAANKRAVSAMRDMEAALEQARVALERTRDRLSRAWSQTPVRDAAETLAEADAALRAIKEARK